MRPPPLRTTTTRAALLRRVLALHATTLLLPAWPTAPARAFDLDATFALTPLLQLRDAVADADGALFTPLLQSPASVIEEGGIAIEEGASCRGSVRELLKQGRPRESGRALASAARRGGLLTPYEASEVERHAREAEERLASILEFEFTNSFKQDALGNAERVMRPEELSYVHRALVSARQELELACAQIPAAERAQAVLFIARLEGKQPPPVGRKSNLPDLDEEPAARRRVAAADATTLAARDAAVLSAIAKLPSPVGTVLTRGDLQTQLNNAWSAQNGGDKLPRTLPVPQGLEE